MAIRMKPAGKIITLVLFIAAGVVSFQMYRNYKGISGDSPGSLLTPSSSDNIILTIAGSTVMSEDLAPELAQGYMEENGYENVTINNRGAAGSEVTGTLKGKKESILIQPVGNSAGMTAISEKKADIAISLLEAPANNNDEEKEVGMDAVGIIVSKDNKNVTALSVAEIADIFEGTSSTKMNLYVLDKTNEYYEFFDQEIMEKKRISATAKGFSDEKELLDAVAKDPNGIGFVDYEFLKNTGIRVVPIKETATSSPILPNDLTIQSEEYPLAMRIYMYSSEKPDNPHIQKFLDWIEEDEGQDIVEKTGFVNFDVEFIDDTKNPEVNDTDPPEYKKLAANGKMISTEFRFEYGGSTLDSRANDDIERVIKFLSKDENKRKSLVLVGFTDNQGNPAGNIGLSLNRANTLRDALKLHGAKISRTLGLGSAIPLRDNGTEEGRAENRRVEVWVEN